MFPGNRLYYSLKLPKKKHTPLCFSLLVKPELTGATTAPVRSLGRLPFRLDSKRKSLVSVDQLSSGFTVKTNVVSPTCVPRLKP